jgi:hypothetical protein
MQTIPVTRVRRRIRVLSSADQYFNTNGLIMKIRPGCGTLYSTYLGDRRVTR